jgi:hypothetical protein
MNSQTENMRTVKTYMEKRSKLMLGIMFIVLLIVSFINK